MKGGNYTVNDDKAGYYQEIWKQHTPDEVVDVVLKNKSLWDTDLSGLKGFAEAVREDLHMLMNKGAAITLAQSGNKKIVL